MGVYLPVALSIAGRPCLVVGGGAVAARKIQSLVEAGASVTVVASAVSAPVREAAARCGFRVHLRPFEAADVDTMFLVIAATADAAVNRDVAAAARARGALVNCVDDASNCDFVFPAVVRRGDVQIAISTGGRTPALARHLRERLGQAVPAEYGPLAEILGAVREGLRREGVRVDREAWQSAIDGRLLRLVRQGQGDRAAALLRSRLTRGMPRSADAVSAPGH